MKVWLNHFSKSIIIPSMKFKVSFPLAPVCIFLNASIKRRKQYRIQLFYAHDHQGNL
jgi:hypothetical protein